MIFWEKFRGVFKKNNSGKKNHPSAFKKSHLCIEDKPHKFKQVFRQK
jgi:hypothetical protein